MRTNFYVDGFNLYYGCLRNTPYRWLNLVALCRRSFPTTNTLRRVRYFTARVGRSPSDPQQHIRQQTYLRALALLPELTIHYGHLLRSDTDLQLVSPPAGGPATARVWRFEE